MIVALPPVFITGWVATWLPGWFVIAHPVFGFVSGWFVMRVLIVM